MARNLPNYYHLGYGIFPYFIIRECSGIYRQIPIHFSKEELQSKDGIYIPISEKDSYECIQHKCLIILKDLILGEIKAIGHEDKNQSLLFFGKQKKEGCLVLNPEEAIYFDFNGKQIAIGEIPFGGTLISVSGAKMNANGDHYNFTYINGIT